jgi:hypothetical protein
MTDKIFPFKPLNEQMKKIIKDTPLRMIPPSKDISPATGGVKIIKKKKS